MGESTENQLDSLDQDGWQDGRDHGGRDAVDILFVDDFQVVRTALSQLILQHLPGARIVPVDTSAEAVRLLSQKRWSLALLELSIQDRDGMDVLLQARSMKISPPVLVLTVEREDHFAIRAMKLGAAGFLRKTCHWDELRTAIDTVLRGEKFISPWLAQRMARYLVQARPVDYMHEILSDREFQVLRMIGSGKTVKEIGATLQLSVKTISTYRTRILEKMEFTSNADLVGYCASQGLLPVPHNRPTQKAADLAAH